jgi:anti-sigma B factor antagonist
MDGLAVETIASGRGLVGRVSGEMDYLREEWFRGRFKELIGRGGRFFVLDLAGVSLCDSVGLNVLLGAWRQADAGASLWVWLRVLTCLDLSPSGSRRRRPSTSA